MTLPGMSTELSFLLIISYTPLFTDFVKHFFPDLPLEKAREMLQEILKVTLYKGNSGHQDILRQEGKCQVYDPAPLVLVKDIMTYMPQIKYMFSNLASEQPASKRQKVN